ncbi:YqzE family protein [Paenibacillus sp. FA6]|uniref:YqzE family protein n=1 Tax=Paenibacillus sp. FA6 TaxID=3413029 RepID=UPI003F65DFC1
MGDELKLVKYITEQVVTYMETPREERRRAVKEPWSTKWFGMIPIGLTLWRRNRHPISEASWQDTDGEEN